MAKDYRCLICEQDIEASETPDYCPHCFGSNSMIIPAEEERKAELPKLSFVTGENIASIILLENEVAELAHWAGEKGLSINREAYEKVSRSDGLHSEALRKLMKLKSPVPNFSKGLPLEYPELKGQLRDKKFELYHLYLKAAQEAVEADIRDLLLAILEAEDRGTAMLEGIF